MNRRLVTETVGTFLSVLLCVGSICANERASTPIRLHDLKVEHLTDPIQLDVAQPRLSWKIMADDRETKNIQQQSYHVLVSSSIALLEQNTGDLWDSGQVTSAQSILIPYKGKELKTRQACYWKVRVTDNQGTTSAWSEVAKWQMALLDENDWSGSDWIGYKDTKRGHELASRQHVKLKQNLQSHTSPLLRHEIAIAKPIRKAMAYVCGLGYSEFYINGNKIGDNVLDPGQTNYGKHTLYVVHDVTKDLIQGKNALGVWLGNGFYGQNIGFGKKFGYGQPSLRAKLFVEYEDGTTEEFGTNTSWQAKASPIVFDNVYWGESYDARLEIAGWSNPGSDSSNWQAAIRVPAPCPEKQLKPQLLPPIQEAERLKPVQIRQVAPKTWLLDFGKNIAGWVDITVDQNAGDVIKIVSSEVLDKKTRRVDQRTQGGSATGRDHELFYVCKGGGEESWAPRFTYTGFQYVEISGLDQAPDAASIQAVFVRSAVEKTGSFACSNELLNQQYAASLLSLEGNWHSVPEDCPHREKCGWLGDAHATADLCLYNYDILRFYAKFNRDIQDSLVTRFNDGSGSFKIGNRTSKVPPGIGGVPSFVAPGKRSARLGSIDWGVAYLILPWRMYLHSGDEEAFRPHYDHIKDFITFYRTYKTTEGVIDNGLGDWCPPRWDRRNAPEFMECHPYVSGTAFYFQALKIAAGMAEVVKDDKFREQCLKEAEEIRVAFRKVYLKSIADTDLRHYGSQTATAMALNLGMVDETDRQNVVDALVHDIVELHDGHHACGIHGQRHLYTVLANQGHDDLVYQMLTDTTFPSPGYVLSCGLSTWPERRFEWDKVRYSNSFNHPMNGGFAAFMHESLAGVRPDESQPGYRHFVLKPHLTSQIDWVKSSVETPYGKIRSDWKNESDLFSWEVDVPVNTSVTLFIPCSENKQLSDSSFRDFLREPVAVEDSGQRWLQVKVGSGTYAFSIK